METVYTRLRLLVEGYLSEYGCPLAYADEIAEGILDNFAVSFKDRSRAAHAPEAPNRLRIAISPPHFGPGASSKAPVRLCSRQVRTDHCSDAMRTSTWDRHEKSRSAVRRIYERSPRQ